MGCKNGISTFCFFLKKLHLSNGFGYLQDIPSQKNNLVLLLTTFTNLAWLQGKVWMDSLANTSKVNKNVSKGCNVKFFHFNFKIKMDLQVAATSISQQDLVSIGQM